MTRFLYDVTKKERIEHTLELSSYSGFPYCMMKELRVRVTTLERVSGDNKYCGCNEKGSIHEQSRTINTAADTGTARRAINSSTGSGKYQYAAIVHIVRGPIATPTIEPIDSSILEAIIRMSREPVYYSYGSLTPLPTFLRPLPPAMAAAIFCSFDFCCVFGGCTLAQRRLYTSIGKRTLGQWRAIRAPRQHAVSSGSHHVILELYTRTARGWLEVNLDTYQYDEEMSSSMAASTLHKLSPEFTKGTTCNRENRQL